MWKLLNFRRQKQRPPMVISSPIIERRLRTQLSDEIDFNRIERIEDDTKGRRKSLPAIQKVRTSRSPRRMSHWSTKNDLKKDVVKPTDKLSDDWEPVGRRLSGNRLSVVAQIENQWREDEKDGKEKKNEDGEKQRKLSNGPVDTHLIKKVAPFDLSLCRICNEIIYVNGFECVHCGLICHQPCLSSLIITCNHHQLPPKARIFGADLTHQDQRVPELVLQCVAELERRGFENIKRVYIKPEMTDQEKKIIAKLCCSLENGPHLVDFTSVSHLYVGEILKLYLAELSSPLIPSTLESKLLLIAKKWPCSSNPDKSHSSGKLLIFHLKLIVSRLPKQHYTTLGHLMSHLRKIAEHHKETRMSVTLLAIIFTPILTKPIDVSVGSRVNALLRTRTIELMITFADDVFTEDFVGIIVNDKRRLVNG